MFKVTPFTSLIIHFPRVRKLQRVNNNCLSVLRLLWTNWLSESSSILVSAKDRFRELSWKCWSTLPCSPFSVTTVTSCCGPHHPIWEPSTWLIAEWHTAILFQAFCLISTCVCQKLLASENSAMRSCLSFSRTTRNASKRPRTSPVWMPSKRKLCPLSWNGRHQHPHRCTARH